VAKADLLGGRLHLLAQGDLSDGQKQLYQRMRTNQVPWASRHNFRGMTDDERLIGCPFTGSWARHAGVRRWLNF